MAKRFVPKTDIQNAAPSGDKPAEAVDKVSEEASLYLPPISNTVLTKEMEEKLGKYDALQENVNTLLREKEDLMEKLSIYLTEIEDLRAADKSLKCSESEEVNALKAKIKELEKDNKELEKSQDEYLARISQLTFETMKLRQQIGEIPKDSKTKVPENKPETRLERPTYNPYKHNGYNDWN